jgi:hypothetical protein
LELQHPSGQRWTGTFIGDGNTVQVALTQLLMDHENDYRDDKARGDRRPEPGHDGNRRVNEVMATIVPRR